MFARRARGGVTSSCATLIFVHALDDGTYDGFIVWAETRENDRVTLEITITTGARKGEVVNVNARAFQHDLVALIGLPCTLVVHDGVPRVELDV
jgi:hypothetical protein